MKLSIKTIILFLACLAVINMSYAAPPTLYKEVYADAGSPLKGKVFVSDDATGISTYEQNGLIIVSSDIHYEDITLKFKATAINAVFGYTPKSIEWKHKNDAGEIDATGIVNLGEPDAQGNYILYNVSLSTLIIGGVTSTVTQECTGIFNLGWCNLSYPVNAIDNITAIITGLTNTWSVNGLNWNYRSTITQTATSGFSGAIEFNNTNLNITQTQFDNIEVDGNNNPIFNLTYENGTNIPFFSKWWGNSSNFSFNANMSLEVGNSTLYLYSNGNSGLQSGSNGNATHIQHQGAWSSAGGNYLLPAIINSTSFIYEASVVITTEDGDGSSMIFGVANESTFINGASLSLYAFTLTNQIRFFSYKATGQSTLKTQSPDMDLNTRYNLKIIKQLTNTTAYYNGAIVGTTTTTNLPITPMGLGVIRTPVWVSGHDYAYARPYLADLPTHSISGEKTVISNMYFAVTGHANSENKTTINTSMILNSTATVGIPVQYSQFFTNNTAPFNVSLSYQVLDNYTQIQKQCIDSVCIYNNTITFNGIYNNVNITVEKIYNESSNYFDNFTISTNDANYSGVTENNTAYVIHSNGTNASQPYFYNFTHDELPQPPLFRPNNLTILTSFTGTLNNTFLNDSVEIVATETTGTPSRLNFTFNLSNTVHTGINYLLRFYGYYDGNPAHETHAFVKYCDNETFVEISNATYFINDANDNYSRIFPFTGNQYRCSNGSMVVKLEHIQTTSPNHYLHVNLLNIEIFPTLPKPTISGTTVVCGADDAFGCANLNSTSDDTYSLYHWYWRLNGTTPWNSSSNTTVNGTQIELTKGLTYDFRLYASNGYDFISEYSEYITITMATGDPQHDIMIANQNTIIAQNNQIIANQEDIQTSIEEAKATGIAGGILGGAMVLMWLKRRKRQQE